MVSSKKYFIFLISTVVVFFGETAINIACGPEPDPYDYYVSFFHNDVQGGKEYGNFYLSEYLYLFDETEPANEAEINAGEWAAALDYKIKDRDVHHIMYGIDRQSDSLLTEKLDGAQLNLPDSLASDPFVQLLLKKKKNPFREYYTLAKRIEYHNRVYDPWNPEPPDTAALISLMNKSLSGAAATKNQFLKNRYYYQACKLSHFTGREQQAIEIFDKYIDKLSADSHIRGWGMSLKAGALRWLGDSVASAYHFSKVFALYPERRVQAYRNYRNTGADINDVLAMAKNDEEKAIIWGIEGFGDPSFNISYLQHAYQLAPSSKVVGVLLVREINKLESYYLTNRLKKNDLFYNPYQFIRWYNEEDSTSSAKKNDHPEMLKIFCLKLAQERKNMEPEIGTLCAAYICWMQGKNAEAWSYMKQINPDNLKDKLRDQEKIVRLLLSAQKIKEYNQVNEAELLPSLIWLDKKTEEEQKESRNAHYYREYNGESRFSVTARNFYQLILAPAYFSQGDTVNAALAMLKGDPIAAAGKHDFGSWQSRQFFRTSLKSGALEKLLKVYDKEPQVAYPAFLRNGLTMLDKDLLLELEGTALLREHLFSKAALTLKRVDEGKRTRIIMGDYGDSVLTGNPFVDRLLDYPLTHDSVNGYDKLRFAIEMDELEKKIKSDPSRAAACYYRMANGLYNASTYGNSWYLISYSWASADIGRKEKYYYDNDYTGVKTAQHYFTKARNLSRNNEFKARCTFMLAKCYQKQILYPEYTSLFYNNYEKYERALADYKTANISNLYFKELAGLYSGTRFFAVAAGECSYLKDFIRISTNYPGVKK